LENAVFGVDDRGPRAGIAAPYEAELGHRLAGLALQAVPHDCSGVGVVDYCVMTDVRIRTGNAAEVIQPDRRDMMERIREDLTALGLHVDTEIDERAPGVAGVTLIEWTGIFILAIGKEVLSLTVSDGYNAAKKRVRERRERTQKEKGNRSVRHSGVVIYGPDGKELRRWSTKDH
jgi:hypothetical protein